MPQPPYAPSPVLFPLYPAPPVYWRDDHGLMLLCRTGTEVLQQTVPYPFQLAADDGLFVIAIKVCRKLSYPNDDRWPEMRDETRLDLTVPIRYGDIHAEYPIIEYINDDHGLAAGRELWNWPKKLGEFQWSGDQDQLHVECHRQGELLMAADFTGGTEQDAVAWPDGGPALTLRPVNQAGGGRQPTHVEILRTDFPNFTLHSRRWGSASVKLADGRLDPLGSFFGDIDVIGARYDVRDFDFDLGEVIDTVQLPSTGDRSVHRLLHGTRG